MMMSPFPFIKEKYTLLGENGAGKSTFVKMVYGLMKPDAGVFEWRGKPVTIAGPQHARDMGIGMVFQHFSLFQALTVAENIQLALPTGDTIPCLIVCLNLCRMASALIRMRGCIISLLASSSVLK